MIKTVSGEKNISEKNSNHYMMLCLMSEHNVKKAVVNFNNMIKI